MFQEKEKKRPGKAHALKNSNFRLVEQNLVLDCLAKIGSTLASPDLLWSFLPNIRTQFFGAKAYFAYSWDLTFDTEFI